MWDLGQVGQLAITGVLSEEGPIITSTLQMSYLHYGKVKRLFNDTRFLGNRVGKRNFIFKQTGIRTPRWTYSIFLRHLP